jgi:hypothetical protein
LFLLAHGVSAGTFDLALLVGQPSWLSLTVFWAGWGNPARDLVPLLEDYFLEQFGADNFADFGAFVG